MKLSRVFVILLSVGVVVAVGSGCRKKPEIVTQIPGTRGPVGSGDRPIGGLDSGTTRPLDPGNRLTAGNPGGQDLTATSPLDPETGTRPNTGLEQFEGMNQDPSLFSSQTIYFEFDKSTVRPSEIPKAREVAAHLSSNPAHKVLVDGHCDERGTESHNLSLGERRAQSVRETLAQLGVDPDRVRTRSWGEAKPASSGHDESAWELNRRGEFILLTPP